MSVKDRASLIAFVKGLKGNASTLEDVKSFFQSQAEAGVLYTDASGKSFDVDALWAKTVTVRIAADEGEVVSVVDDTPKSVGEMNGEEEEEADGEKAISRAELVRLRKAAARGTSAPSTPRLFSIGNDSARKTYEQKAATGKIDNTPCVLADPDKAAIMGAWFRSPAHKALPSKIVSEDRDILQKAQVSYDAALGGFSVPEILSSELISIRPKFSALEQLGVVRNMPSQGETIPRRGTEATISFPGENGAVTTQTVNGDGVKLSPFKMAAQLEATLELMDRSVFDWGNYIAYELVYATRKKMEEIYFNGNATATYGNQTGFAGALNKLIIDAGGTVPTNWAYAAAATVGANSWGGITAAQMLDFIGTPAELEDPSNLRIVCSRPFFFSTLVRLANAAGGTTTGEMVNGVQTYQYQGIPVIFSNALAQRSAASTISAYLADFNVSAKIALGKDMNIRTNTEGEVWTRDAVAYKITTTAGVNIHDIGNAHATAASRVPQAFAVLVTGT
jgi:HK97 family phage major capsid protein